MINTVNWLTGFYLARIFPEKISHVQACVTNYSLNKFAK